MKILVKIFLLFIAFSVAVSLFKQIALFLPQLSIVFAIGCSLGAIAGAFHHHGHGKPLMYGAIEGGLWLPKKTFEITMAICKGAFRFVMGAV